MVSDLAESHLEWTSPEPLWSLAGDPTLAGNRRQFRTPAILRFATDSFMNDFLNLLNTEPQRLPEFLAMPETWDAPPGEPPPPQQKSGLALKLFRARAAAVRRLQARGSRVLGASQSSSPNTRPLKLYQPVHQRFYLVATCLVCRVLGLPDRRINTAAQERVSFVLRLLQPRLLQPHAGADPNQPDPRDCDEFALVNGAWTPVANPDNFFPGEEQRPLSPAAYQQDDQRRRRLLVGLVPVGDRERLLQALQPIPGGQTPPQSSALPPLVEGPPAVSANGTLQMLLKSQVIGPMHNLELLATERSNASTDGSGGQPPTPAQGDAIISAANDRIQTVSFYILLDLAKYFETNISNLSDVILGKASPLTLSGPALTLWNTLSNTLYSSTSLASALKSAYDAQSTLENVKTPYSSSSTDWPSFRFQFYTASKTGVQGLAPALDRATFETQIVQALPAVNPNPPLPTRSTAQAYSNPEGPVWFTIRCVLERPNCGALSPAFVSEPTAAFQLAAFFDPQAPSRPIRIGLPVDTTPAGLRKFDKNTAFVMSDTLCGQVAKMNSITFADLIMSVLPFPLHKDLSTGDMKPCGSGGMSFGMVCSFSIPIITICALILLIIFVKLLDIIFFWMPFFQICLPLPKFSAKDS
jgi:hypothetical protein